MSKDSYALITGASSGIGECFAHALARRGHNLVLTARSEGKLSHLAAKLAGEHSIKVEVVPADLSIRDAAPQLAAMLKRRNIFISLLVNNAAFGGRGEFWKQPIERQMAMVRLNINALTELTWLLLPEMIKRKEGAIINVSSTASFQPMAYTAVYAATKAFVTSFSMGIAEEVRPHGIRVVTLCPGGTRTNFFEAGNYGVRSIPGGLQPPEEVVDEALKALDAGGGLVVPRLLNKFTVAVQRFLPRALVARGAALAFQPRNVGDST
ncbi:MAG TPA: SDR family oxidoreductase [Terriglobia bacterium]|jgi:short-subunit dehydrogenase|nr:SDR family oxidoreductase [Terriglobia bacterium]